MHCASVKTSPTEDEMTVQMLKRSLLI